MCVCVCVDHVEGVRLAVEGGVVTAQSHVVLRRRDAHEEVLPGLLF